MRFQSIAVFCCLFSAINSYAEESKEVAVFVEQAEEVANGAVSSLSCEFMSQRIFVLSAAVDAELTSILPVGSQVKKNQLVASQDNFYVQNELQKNKIKLAQRQHDLAFHQSEYDRRKNQGEHVSPSELHRLKWQVRTSMSEIALAESEIARLSRDSKKAQLRAPGDFEVERHLSKLGQFVSRGEPVAQLSPLSGNEVVCDMPLSFAAHGSYELASFSYNRQPLTLKRVSNVVNTNTQSKRIYLNEPDGSVLDVGQRISVEMVHTTQQKLFRISADALNFDLDGSAYVWAIDDNKSASRVEVSMIQGTSFNARTTVSGALTHGMRLVVRGANMLSDGETVELVNSTL
ncbi:efflux RND transporter periplasmic adaptor subunit [Pseudoalteromonas rubra]|uniref:efflux RND transporter periplasmic adaptor subunit n=1 Tax=Pseudoalteromonas rubra TaxID=43658 RepID=UPI0013DE483C|nr:efflux RND transporter periplasmic adaptor subunit [Pseudoalteromonas rubra]